MVCEQIPTTEPKPAGSIADWQDGDNTFYLRQRTAQDTAEGDSEIDRISVGGTSRADWRLGENAICKTHSWCEGMQLEADVIRFVQANVPEVPVPEVLYSWIDRDFNRTFLITRRPRGRLLDEAWPHLSSTQRELLARDVTRICVALAANTSSRFEEVSGGAHWNNWFNENPPPSHPTWLPRMFGPWSLEDFQAHAARISTEPFPDIDPPFCLYHSLLGPQCIFVSEDTNLVSTIIHWGSAGYYPRFWVASFPAFYPGFLLECETDDQQLWMKLLVHALMDSGFKQDRDTFLRWVSGQKHPDAFGGYTEVRSLVPGD